MSARRRVLGAAVFGTGGPATGEHARAYQRCAQTRLVAVGSRPGDAALRCAREAGAPDAFVTKDFEALLQHPDVELISITAAPEQRAEMAIRAARAGKHVCIEAPMATSRADCQAIREAIAAAGVRATVAAGAPGERIAALATAILEGGPAPDLPDLDDALLAGDR